MRKLCLLLIISISLMLSTINIVCADSEENTVTVDAVNIDFEGSDWTTVDEKNGSDGVIAKVIKQGNKDIFRFEKLSSGVILDTDYPSNFVINDPIIDSNVFSMGASDFWDKDTKINTMLWHNLENRYHLKDTDCYNPELVTFDIYVKAPTATNTIITLYEKNMDKYSDSTNNIETTAISIAASGELTYMYTTGTKPKTVPKVAGSAIFQSGAYLRQEINLKENIVKIYYGLSLDDMTLWIVNSLINVNTNGIGAIAFGKARGNGLIFDNVHMYHKEAGSTEPKPVASDVTLIGKPNIGQELTATYTYSDEAEENGSAISWIAADDDEFTENVTTLKKDENTTDNTPYKYTITAAEKNKYIKIEVTPKNIDGTEGEMVSAVLPYKIGAFQTSESGFKINGNYVDAVSSTLNQMVSGSVTFVNTDTESYNDAILIAVWHDSSGATLKGVEISPSVNIAGVADGGIITVPCDVNLTQANNMESGDILKLLVWNGLDNLKPYFTTLATVVVE